MLEQRIDAAPNVRLTRSTQDDRKDVIEAPSRLLEECRGKLRDLEESGVDIGGSAQVSLEDYTLARNIASEHSRGSPTEQACIADEALNRAGDKGKSVFDSLCPAGVYGRQGGHRPFKPAATRLDPKLVHLLVARAVVSGEVRGISRGARRYFDPRAQWSAFANPLRKTSCSPVPLVDRWTFDRPSQKRGRACPVHADRAGTEQLQWVGQIAGVDPARLMLFQPATGEQQKRFEQATQIAGAVEGELPVPIFDEPDSLATDVIDSLAGLPFRPESALLVGGIAIALLAAVGKGG